MKEHEKDYELDRSSLVAMTIAIILYVGFWIVLWSVFIWAVIEIVKKLISL